MSYKKTLLKHSASEFNAYLWKKYLKVKDMEEIASETSYSVSTVYKVARGHYPLNQKTVIIEDALNLSVFKKLSEMIAVFEYEHNELKNLYVVRRFLFNKSQNE